MALSRLFKLNKQSVVKVYHGYGDKDMLLVLGHVFKRSPFPQESYKKNIWHNVKSLLKLFMAKPYKHVTVSIEWEGRTIQTTTDRDGFFRLEWHSETALSKGWTGITVTANIQGLAVTGEGKILTPHATRFTYISDIDDTFLVSHSSNVLKRLYELVTKNAQTRKPFENVANHYQRLAAGSGRDNPPNPFFYVSSSEWNLYEYIKEFCRTHELPEGVFLLSPLKNLKNLVKTGRGRHETKYDRIHRIITTFPQREYILLGDDTQKDPEIYARICHEFPGKIKCIYIRHVEKKHYNRTTLLVDSMKEKGTEVFYYQHSVDAITHSKEFGLI